MEEVYDDIFDEFDMLFYIDSYMWKWDKKIHSKKCVYYERWIKLCKAIHNEDVKECKKFFQSIRLDISQLQMINFRIISKDNVEPISVLNSTHVQLTYFELLNIMSAIRNAINNYLNEGVSNKNNIVKGIVQRMSFKINEE